MSVVYQIASCAATGVCAYQMTLIIARRARQMRARSRSRHLTLDEIIHDRTLSFALFAAFGAVVACCIALWVLPLCLLLALVLSRRGADVLDKRKAQRLRSVCDGQLDTMCDIVAMGVRSGLSFDSALDLYCGRFDCELARELREARFTWASGIATRERALVDLANRIDSKAMRRFNDTTLQAIHYGSPLAEMLVQLARDLRAERRVHIERQVEKAPIKMLIPTGVCILPAMLIMVMGPVILQFLSSGI